MARSLSSIQEFEYAVQVKVPPNNKTAIAVLLNARRRFVYQLALSLFGRWNPPIHAEEKTRFGPVRIWRTTRSCMRPEPILLPVRPYFMRRTVHTTLEKESFSRGPSTVGGDRYCWWGDAMCIGRTVLARPLLRTVVFPHITQRSIKFTFTLNVEDGWTFCGDTLSYVIFFECFAYIY